MNAPPRQPAEISFDDVPLEEVSLDISLVPSLSQDHAGKAKVIAICSGKGGVGKTSLATNLSIALARHGNQVCIFDADVSLANVNIMLGLAPQRTLLDFVGGKAEMDDILLEAPVSVQIVPGGGAIEDFVQLDDAQRQRLLDGLRELESRFDYLVVDTAGGIAENQLQLIHATPFVVVVITEEPTSLTDAFSLLKVLKHRKFKRPVLVLVNMATGSAKAEAAFRRFRRAVSMYLKLKVHYLGYVARDRVVSEAVTRQMPYVVRDPDSLASRCVAAIARRLRRLTDVAGGDGGGVSDFLASLQPPAHSSETGHSITPVVQQLAERLPRLDEDEAQALLREVLALWPDAARQSVLEHPEPVFEAPPVADGQESEQAGLRERDSLLAALRVAAKCAD